jgi:hypothetical protein
VLEFSVDSLGTLYNERAEQEWSAANGEEIDEGRVIRAMTMFLKDGHCVELNRNVNVQVRTVKNCQET